MVLGQLEESVEQKMQEDSVGGMYRFLMAKFPAVVDKIRDGRATGCKFPFVCMWV